MKAAMLNQVPRVALLIESSRTYGRGILRGIAHFAHVHGPWSFFTIERDLHGGVPPMLAEWRGDGIIARIEDSAMAARLRKLGCPVIDVLGQTDLQHVPSLDTDPVAVARLAVDFYLKAGFRHFAYIGYPGIPFSDKRRAAFAQLLQQQGRSLRVLPHMPGACGPKHIQAIEQEGIGFEGTIARWLQQQPCPLAVLACNDVRAKQVLNACREHGLRVPDQIAVMGVDNDDVLCALCEPPLSSIEPDAERLGYTAAEMMARMMNGEPNVPARTQIPPVRLIERASTDVVAVEDPITAHAVRFIRDNIGRGIAVKDVIAHMGRSRTDLEQRFRVGLKSSIRREILRLRLARVSSLLRDTDLTIADIAQRSGFSSAAHLCRLFQKRYDMSPTEYRRSDLLARASV